VVVNFIGSGCCAFHTSTLKLDIKDFKYQGMADCYLSRSSFLQNVPMVVLKHGAKYLTYIPPLKGTTLWETNKDYTLQNEILKSYLG
jgi:LysM repeat protein